MRRQGLSEIIKGPQYYKFGQKYSYICNIILYENTNHRLKDKLFNGLNTLIQEFSSICSWESQQYFSLDCLFSKLSYCRTWGFCNMLTNLITPHLLVIMLREDHMGCNICECKSAALVSSMSNWMAWGMAFFFFLWFIARSMAEWKSL